MNKTQLVNVYQYDGSPESLNLMIARCGLNGEDFHVFNMDTEISKFTNKFTGHIYIHKLSGIPHRMSNLYLRPGDYYYVLQEHDNDCYR